MAPEYYETGDDGFYEQAVGEEGHGSAEPERTRAGTAAGGVPFEQPGAVTDSDAFQTYILEMSQHRLISHEESVELAKSMAEAKRVMVEHLARVPSASRRAVELCRKWIDSGAPLSQLLDTAHTIVNENDSGPRSVPTDRQQLLRRIDSLERDYERWQKRKSASAAERLARSFKDLGPNIHLLRDVGSSCRDMALRLAPERAVGAAQALHHLERAAGTDRVTLDEVCSTVRSAEHRYAHAWREMVHANLRLVISVARRFAVGSVPLEDLVQEGNVGLFRAVEKYDHRLGYRFSTYASFWIRQAVTKALVNQGRTMRVPAHMNDKIVKLLNLRAELQRDLGRMPTPGELAKRSDLPLETVQLALESAQATLSLDQTLGDEDSGTFYDITADGSTLSAEETSYASELQDIMSGLLDRLPERESLILRLRHGIGDTEPMTLEQIARVIGVSRERVRQLEARAVGTLRTHLASDAAHLEEDGESQVTASSLNEQ